MCSFAMVRPAAQIYVDRRRQVDAGMAEVTHSGIDEPAHCCVRGLVDDLVAIAANNGASDPILVHH